MSNLYQLAKGVKDLVKQTIEIKKARLLSIKNNLNTNGK